MHGAHLNPTTHTARLGYKKALLSTEPGKEKPSFCDSGAGAQPLKLLRAALQAGSNGRALNNLGTPRPHCCALHALSI